MTTVISVSLVIAAVFLVFMATRPEPKRQQRQPQERPHAEPKPAEQPASTPSQPRTSPPSGRLTRPEIALRGAQMNQPSRDLTGTTLPTLK
ncbi:MAG: hypothetical protein IT335_08660 [Thermomicrobiales bacterium]|nr:hypothetical protein [Thermomicrobiales bacterium]